LDITSIIGLIMGILAVVGGAALEGLHLGSITQPTAAVIVLGGTLGATILSFPLKTIIGASKSFATIFFEPKHNEIGLLDEIITYSSKARKDGLIALESMIPNVPDKFMQRALSLAVAGTDPKTMRDIMEIEISQMEDEKDLDARVFECAGGYAPTIGIIGAVLGLIHVMAKLDNPSEIGGGIAVAFVATVYGVASANLIFLPIANKLKVKLKNTVILKTMAMEGVMCIVEGWHPRLIEERMLSYFSEKIKLQIAERTASKKRSATAEKRGP